MAIWSFDLPSLTDGDVFNTGETPRMITEMLLPGFGDDTDMESVTTSGEGVLAVASTTYSLKVLVDFLTSPEVDIPVRAVDLGTITPVEIRKAFKISDGKRQFSTILAFGVDVTHEASRLAARLQVKVIRCSVLETLCQLFKDHIRRLGEETEMDDEAIFPCVLRILPNCVFNKDDPVVLGVLVVYGFIKVGTPICNLRSGCLDIGRIAWIEKDHRSVNAARLGDTVMIKIVASNPEERGLSFGSHFDISDDILVSHISRKSLNVLKSRYRDVVSRSDVRVLCNLKCVFNIE
ncbi:unnamed protein product [Arabidopsis halleri]